METPDLLQPSEQTPSLKTEELAAAQGLRRRSLVYGLRFIFSKALLIGVSIFLAVFLTVLLINNPNQKERDVGPPQLEYRMWQQIEIQTRNYLAANPEIRELPQEEQGELLQSYRNVLIEESGLNLPFLQRHLKWTINALSFNWGRFSYITPVRPSVFYVLKAAHFNLNSIILQHLPFSVLLAGSAFLIVFLLGVPLALICARNYGKWFDRAIAMLAPLSSIPSWVMGILFIFIFAIELQLLPFGGMLDMEPPATKIGYIPIVLKHMVLPVAAIVFTTIFQLVYSWRTFFVAFSEEDYVDLGKAMGLHPRTLEKKYILRPSLPYVITSFSLMVIGYWQISMALEAIFDWEGIGWLYIKYGLPNFWGERMYGGELLIALSLVVIFAYLLGVIVLVLDITYLFVDPRIRYGLQDARVRAQRPGFKITDLFKRRVRFSPQGQASYQPVKPPPKKIAENPQKNPTDDFHYARQRLKQIAFHIKRYPSAIFGLTVILLLLAGSIYVVIALPYETIGEEWGRSTLTGMPDRPRLAKPSWVNFFRANDYLGTMELSTSSSADQKVITSITEDVGQVTYTLSFDYNHQDFPSEVILYLEGFYASKKPFVEIDWITPDGRTISFKGVTAGAKSPVDLMKTLSVNRMVASNDHWRKWFVVGTNYPTPAHYLLFADPSADHPAVLQGTYTLVINAMTFEEDSDIRADVFLFGQVYGMAGTDNYRRDLVVPLLWGMPFALIIGLGGSLSTALISMFFAAAGVWVGGWLDNLVQRITEINLVMPVLAISVLAYAYLGIPIWVILGVIVLANAFGTPTKNFRAAFLQIRNSPYIEAADVYGASDFRIVVKYMMPRIITSLIPQIILLIPSFVFLEATLGLFNISSIYPTWGKVIYQALSKGAWFGSRYWVLQPLALLLITGLGFSMFGVALERILNPRLTRD